jgi:type II secretory pathway pseudopilin PulG
MRRNSARNGEGGYVLLMLLLTVALMIIAAGIILPSITFDIKRDREEELIHRGVQYSRAIKIYYKKFGRYPSKIEDLESTNNLRFLRKRFKDPMNCKGGTCKDFKLLHFGEVTMSGGLGGMVQGATPVSAMSSNGSNGPGGLGSGSSFGSSFGNSSLGNSSFGNSSLGGNSGSLLSSNSSSQSGQNQTGLNQPNGGTGSDNSTDSSAQSANGSGTSSGEGTGQTFGGAPIVGVVSAVRDETIREFNHKHKYSEWQFIYDPGTDRGGLLMTPNQPQLFGGQQNLNGNQQNGNGTNGQQNGPGTGFSTGTGFSLSSPSNNNGLNSNQNPPQTSQPAPSPQSPQ